MSARTPGRCTSALRLFTRCLVWGVATGAAAGAAVGAAGALLAVFSGPSLGELFEAALIIGFYGTVLGAIVAILPSVLGGLLVTEVIRHRHPQPSMAGPVRRDLGLIFYGLVSLLNAGVLLAILVYGTGVASRASGLPYLMVADACVALMLHRARGSISHAWAKPPENIAPELPARAWGPPSQR